MIRDRYIRLAFLEVSGLDNESVIKGISSSFEFSSAQFQNGEIAENKRILTHFKRHRSRFIKYFIKVHLHIPFINESQTVWLQKPLKNGTSNLIIKTLITLF